MMTLQEEVNAAKKKIQEAAAELAQKLDAAHQSAAEAEKALAIAKEERAKLAYEADGLEKLVNGLRLQKSKLESAVSELKAFLDKHILR